MSTLVVWSAVIVTLAIATIIHTYFHLRTYWKDRSMPTLHEDNEESYVPPPASGGIPALPAEHSVNDVHLMREQDQTIAQLSAQLEAMVEEPWICGTMTTDGWGGPIPKTQLRATALLLTFAMNPPAAKGSQAAVSGYGTLQYINVGNQRITAAGNKEADALLRNLNDLYYTTIAQWREDTLAAIAAYAEEAEVERFNHMIYTVECGQTKVGTSNQEEQQALVKLLNATFSPFFAAERKRIRTELIEAAHR